MTKPQDQQTLFGEVDQVFNCLHTELTAVNGEIESAQKSIDRLEKRIEELDQRKSELLKAIGTIGKKKEKKEKKSRLDNPNSLRKCPSCGSILLDETETCPGCGEKI